MKGYFKLVKAWGGTCHFTEIQIEISNQSSALTIDKSIDGPPPEFIEVIKNGSDTALNYIQREYNLTSIDKFFWHDADVSYETIWLASFLAVLNCFGEEKNATLIFDNEKQRMIIGHQESQFHYKDMGLKDLWK